MGSDTCVRLEDRQSGLRAWGWIDEDVHGDCEVLPSYAECGFEPDEVELLTFNSDREVRRVMHASQAVNGFRLSVKQILPDHPNPQELKCLYQPLQGTARVISSGVTRMIEVVGLGPYGFAFESPTPFTHLSGVEFAIVTKRKAYIVHGSIESIRAERKRYFGTALLSLHYLQHRLAWGEVLAGYL